jgi:class 3 adenylate cyclase
VLRPGDQVAISRIAFLFTDIKGSSDLYNRVGDARAYGLVRDHYAVLTRAVREHDGAVVKTIGDAVMAAFTDPADALDAALAIRADIATFNRRIAGEIGPGAADATVAIVVKLGLHCGPCIAVTLNDRLDYFGRTVNLAARLQNESLAATSCCRRHWPRSRGSPRGSPRCSRRPRPPASKASPSRSPCAASRRWPRHPR